MDWGGLDELDGERVRRCGLGYRGLGDGVYTYRCRYESL